MKIKKIFKIGVAFFVMYVLAFGNTNVLANGIKTEITTTTTEIQAQQEEEVILKLRLSDFQDVENGTYAYKGQIQYDQNIFYEIKEKDFIPKNSWSHFQYNEKTKEFVLVKNSVPNKEEEFLTIKVKVKKDAKAGDAQFLIKNQITSEGKEDIKLKDSKIIVKVIQEAVSNQNETNQFNNETKQKELKETSVATVSEKGLIHKDSIVLIFVVEIVVFVVLYAFMKYKKIIVKNKKLVGTMIAILVLIQLLVTGFAITSNSAKKGKLNNDNIVDYQDLEKIEEHLIGIESLPNEKYQHADINNDGKITVSDVVALTNKIEQSRDYEVQLEGLVTKNYYPSKNQEIALEFIERINYDKVSIEKLVINDQEYVVNAPNESNQKFTVKLKTGEKYGEKEFKITKAILTNGKEVSLDEKLIIYVLKEKPFIDEISYKVDDTSHGKATISFHLTDEEESLISSQLTVSEISEIDGEVKHIYETPIKAGKNKHKLTVEDGKTYRVEMCLDYNLASKKVNKKEFPAESVLFIREFTVNFDYQFQLSNLKAMKEGKETYNFTKGEKIDVAFDSSNVAYENSNISDYEPSIVTINDKEYQVSKENGHYVTTIDGINKTGKQNITVQKVKLGNGKEFQLDQTFRVQVMIEEKKASVNKFEIKENLNDNQLTFAFNLKDLGNTIQTAKIVLYDRNDNVIEEQSIGLEEIKNKIIEKEFSLSKTTEYKVKVIATYKVTDTTVVEDGIIYEKEFVTSTRAGIVKAEQDLKQVEKNGLVKITYEIDTNSDKNINKIRVNDVNYLATKLSENKYEVIVQTSDQAQLLKLHTTKVFFEDGTEAQVDHTLTVTVLKAIPAIKDVRQEFDLHDKEVLISFKLDDQDNSFRKGKVTLVKTGKGKTNLEQVIEEKELKVNQDGIGNVTLSNIEDNVEYMAKFFVTYNRFSGTEEQFQKDQLLKELPIRYMHDYKLSITNLKTSTQDKETKHFDKNQSILLSFNSTNAVDFEIKQIMINDKLYEVTRNASDRYQTTLPGYSTSGMKTIQIEKVIFTNSFELEVNPISKINVEVLKDKPTITDFVYSKDKKNYDKIVAKFKLNDLEKTLQNGTIEILNRNKQLIHTESLKDGVNEIVFKAEDSSYYIVVTADYNLGTTNETLHRTQNLLNEQMEFTNRMIEMKDILDVNLYKKNGDKVEELAKVNPNDLINKEQYLVKVQMKDLPEFYTTIKSYGIDGDQLKLELDYENVTQYHGDQKTDRLEVVYGKVENGIAKNNSFSSLLAQIKSNPTGTFTLTRDYDASSFAGDHTSLLGVGFVFRGTINGNGHKISNLSRPIFNEIQNATIKDLVLNDVYLANTANIQGRGALANKINENSKISNVHVKNMTIITNLMFSGFGGITGELVGSTIEKSSVTNLSISGPDNGYVKNVGGITGIIGYSTIQDSYVTGEISGKQYIGGIAGGVNPYVYEYSYITNCFTKVNINPWNGPSESGGIIGYVRRNNQAKLKQNISLSSGSKAYKVHGGNVSFDDRTDNYTIIESNLVSNNDWQIKEISKEEFTGKFLEDRLGFDPKVWNLTNYSYDKLPTLKNADPNKDTETKKTLDHYIPNKARLMKMAEYDVKKEILYSNLFKLMPFYDAKYLVLDGDQIDKDNLLNKQSIKTVLPYNEQGTLVLALTKDNYQQIKSIRVVFDDKTTQTYQLSFESTYGNVANYQIEELNIGYNFSNYIIQQDAKIVSELIHYIQNLDYTRDLQPMVSLDRGHPSYRVNFENVVKNEANLKQFVYNFLSNVGGYSVSNHNEMLSNLIQSKLINTNEMKRILFAYNYYSRFYSMDMNGANLSDVLMFKPELYRENTNFLHLINDFWNSRWKNSHVNYQFYRDTLGQRVGIGKVGEFIDYNIKVLTNDTNPDDWFKNHFKGLLVESPAKGYENGADYRAWTQLKKREQYVLALLTLPEDAGYMISAPGIFFVGSQRVYLTDPKNLEERDALQKKMESFANQVSIFYGTTLGFIERKYLDGVCDIAIDTRFLPKLGEQFNNKTNDLFHKEFNELLDEWSMIGGVGAYSGNQKMHFVTNHILDSYYAWSHETGHNQASRVFFKNHGFRPNGGALTDGITGNEDYPDGNISQNFGDGDVNFNLSYDYPADRYVTTNLTTERINTKDKIESYYKGMFEAIDYLDYVEAKAFLQLSAEEQSKVAVQIYYPNSNDHSTVGWKTLSKEEFETMNLKTVDDIYRNKITIKPGVTGNTTQTGVGDYGSEGLYIRRWYQPHNDNGRTHTYGFKYTAWQMLGIGGYDNGYISYYSGKSKNDLEAIRKVTNDETMTWEKFKKNRYQKMEENWNKTTYVNSDELVKTYVEALRNDARHHDRNVTNSTNVRRHHYHYLKRATDDFRQEVFKDTQTITHIKSSEAFQKELKKNPTGHFVLDNDIDLSSLTGEHAIIDGFFMGKLDGNGHKLFGNHVPVFQTLRFAKIQDLTIESSTISDNQIDTGALARKVETSEIVKVIGKNIQVSSTDKQVGGLIGSMTGSFIKNTHMIETIVNGNARVGTLVGYVGQSQIEESSTNGTATSTANATGGFIGEIYDKTTIKNSYSVGEAKGNQDIGGFVGYVNGSSIINSFSNAKASGTGGFASFVGQTIQNSVIQNNITLVNQPTGYKFDGRTANNGFTNFKGNYENKANAGESTLNRAGIDFNGKISVAEESQVKDSKFYHDAMQWDTNIWDFTNVKVGGLPKLRNADPNNITSSVKEYAIHTAEEFKELLIDHPDSTFIIENDIDLSKINSNEDTIISGTFMGKIKGNNYKLFGNKKPIFKNLKYANISDLKLEDSIISSTQNDIGALSKKATKVEFRNITANNLTISAKEHVGGLVGTMEKSIINHVHVTNGKISGTNQVGGLAGTVNNNTITETSADVVVISTGTETGGLIGKVTNATSIENSYTSGIVKGTNMVGGFVGSSTDSTLMKNFARTSVSGGSETAGFIGTATNSTIQHNVSLGNQNKEYKFAGEVTTSQINQYQGNYEYQDNAGIAISDRKTNDFSGRIDVATKNQITNIDFYITTLGWSQDVWDFVKVTNEHTPKLKKFDSQEDTRIMVKDHINSVDEFIIKLTQRPDGEYTLTQKLDFKDKKYNVGSVVISEIFFGKIDGNGHAIENLKNATLFEQFDGEVSRLNMNNFQHGIAWSAAYGKDYVFDHNSDKTRSHVSAFAKKTVEAKLSNMRFNYILIAGNHNLAVVSSNDTNSTFENINVTQALILGGAIQNEGKNASAFISEKTGGSIKNCYVQGEVYARGNHIGGIIGSSHGAVTIDRVVSNILAMNYNEQVAKTSGLFIGNINGATKILNSVSIGKTNSIYLLNKFAPLSNVNIALINNSYENSDAEGIESSNGSNIKAISKKDLLSREFYVNKLHFDETIWDLEDIKEIIYTETPYPHNPDTSKNPKIITFGLKK